jgi:hypothetical protein
MTTLEPRTNLRPSRTLDSRIPVKTGTSDRQPMTQAVWSAVNKIEEAALQRVARPEAGLACGH